MQTLPRITFHHLPYSQALEARINEMAGGLNRDYDGIISCHVVVEAYKGRGDRSAQYAARIELTLPGGAINATNTPSNLQDNQQGNSDPYIAVRDAFSNARRQLLDFAVAH